MVFPVVSQTLVEGGILLRLDVLRVASPDGFRFVELLVRRLRLLDLLGLLVLGLVVLIIDFLDLGLVLILLVLLFLFILYLLMNQMSVD